jgi:hypothetical protein
MNPLAGLAAIFGAVALGKLSGSDDDHSMRIGSQLAELKKIIKKGVSTSDCYELIRLRDKANYVHGMIYESTHGFMTVADGVPIRPVGPKGARIIRSYAANWVDRLIVHMDQKCK